MPREITAYRVFVASPGGLQKERKAFRDAIEAYNQAEAIHRGVLFIPVGWEDTLGGVGRPQSIINRDIRDCDFFVLLLWDRWGSPPDRDGVHTSGTEEEFAIALECLRDAGAPMRQIVMFFKGLKPKQLADPGPQLSKVIEFRKKIEMEKEHLFHSFDSANVFKNLLTRHLGVWLRADEEDLPSESVPLVDPSPTLDASVHGDDALTLSNSDELETAWRLADEGRRTEAETMFARAVVAGTEPQSLIDYGRFLERDGRLDQAMVMFEKARATAVSHADPVLESQALTWTGHILLTRGDLAGAEEMYRTALEIDEELEWFEGMADDFVSLGTVLATRGDLAGAEEMYRKALRIDVELDRIDGISSAYGNLGIVLCTRGDLEGAEEMYRKALEIAEKLGRLDSMASHYGNLGNLLATRGELAAAEELHRKSLQIEQQLGRLEGMASDFGNLGNVLWVRGDLAGAEEMYRKALEIYHRLGNLQGLATVSANLGLVLETCLDLAGAEEMYRKALEINEKIGLLTDMATNYGMLGNVLQMRGDHAGAEEMYRKQIEINKRLGGGDE